jgi:phage terminase small subunit
MKGSKLTLKQTTFCEYYIETGNASEAYRRAYDASRMKDETINERASRLLKEYKVSTRIEQIQKELRDKSDITKDEILSRLSAIARSDIRDYVEFDGKSVKFKSFEKLTDVQAKAIEGIKETKYGIELKLHGMSWSIERICKLLGFDSPDKVDLTSAGKRIDNAPTEVIFRHYDGRNSK